jgi:hypothetical protein
MGAACCSGPRPEDVVSVPQISQGGLRLKLKDSQKIGLNEPEVFEIWSGFVICGKKLVGLE